MPEESMPVPESVESAEAEKPVEPVVQEEDVGEFVNRHIFEKDSVFFEG